MPNITLQGGAKTLRSFLAPHFGAPELCIISLKNISYLKV